VPRRRCFSHHLAQPLQGQSLPAVPGPAAPLPCSPLGAIPPGVPQGVPSAVARARAARNLRLPSRQPCARSWSTSDVRFWAQSIRGATACAIQVHEARPWVSASGSGGSLASWPPLAAPQRPPALEPQNRNGQVLCAEQPGRPCWCASAARGSHRG
jgi:hypothetical protein